LERLGLDQVDSISAHEVHDDVESLFGPGAVLAALRKAKDEGLTRHIGITGHRNPKYLVAAVERFEFDTALVPVNPLDRRHLSFIEDFASVAARRGVAVVAVVGHLTSSATIAAAPVYNRRDRPVAAITPSASNPTIGTLGPYTFRACPHDLVHGTRLARWAQERLAARRAGVLYLNDDYGRGMRAAFSQSFTALGGTVVSEDPYLLTVESFEPYLSRLRALGGVDVLMIAGFRTGAERILATLDSLDLEPTILGGDGLTGIERSAVGAEGVYISEAYLPDRPGRRNEAFVAAYRAAFGDRPLDHRGATTYDIVYLLARAVAKAGPDREAIREYLAGVGTATPPFDGVTGVIAFDEDGEVPAKDV
ncbi:MAG: ABC transporter substrate-binding protein, partial [Chloroflexi bacterium]|nr:ABC transporter substrate-binding protein [Chloroflexota bacterium]